MKILHVINSLKSGGAERLVVDLSLEALRYGDEASILTLSPGTGVPRRDAERENLHLIDLGLNRFNASAINRIQSIATNYDVVNAHLFPAFYWATQAKAPSVYTKHGMIKRRTTNRILTLSDKYAYSKYDHIVAVSNGALDSLYTDLGNLSTSTPASVIPNGIREEFYTNKRSRSSRNPLRLVSIGSLSPIKNLELAIDATAETPGVSLDLLGEGPMRGTLQDRIEHHGIENRVRLLGLVEDLPSYLERYDVLLSTSLSESFGLVAAEAMAAGLPVIGPNVAGFNEVVVSDKTGLLFEEHSPQAISSLILKLHDTEMFQRLSKQAISHAKTFHISRTYEAYRRLYSSLL